MLTSYHTTVAVDNHLPAVSWLWNIIL